MPGSAARSEKATSREPAANHWTPTPARRWRPPSGTTSARSGSTTTPPPTAWPTRVVRPTSVPASLFVIHVLIPPLIEAMWLTQLYEVRRLQAFLRTREATKLLGTQFIALPPEARAGVRRLYEDVSQVVRRGETLGLRPDEIDHIMLSWAERPGTPVTTVLAEMNTYAGPLGGSRTARHRIAPESVLDEATRRLLPEYAWRIASTGGIRSIRASLNPKRARVVTIEGVLKPSLARSASRAGPDQLVAPNFNATAKLFSGRDLGLARPEERQLLQLWGPGFGDEAAAGIMLGPRAVTRNGEPGSGAVHPGPARSGEQTGGPGTRPSHRRGMGETDPDDAIPVRRERRLPKGGQVRNHAGAARQADRDDNHLPAHGRAAGECPVQGRYPLGERGRPARGLIPLVL